jgi:membrane protein implicated in regulation of membrane protease activity
MKIVLLLISVVMTLVSAFRIVKILVRDLDRLTNFGYGYLTGQVILFLIFLFASLLIGRRIYRQSEKGYNNRD